jgi:L-iditol 2-dehydrogenase
MKVSTMEALRIHGPGDVRVHVEPDPVPGAGEVLVRVTAVGLCGSDLHWYDEGAIGDATFDEPLVLGHEMGGTIAEGPAAGQRVAIDPALPCGHCAVCRAGNANLCVDVRFCGHTATDGGLRTLMAWPRRLLLPVPDGIEDDDVALLEPLGIALHALELGHIKGGMSAGVFGCGPIGLLLIRALKAAGVERIIATDALPHRLDAARASGADTLASATIGGQPQGLEGWEPVDVAFEVAGEDAALETALRSVAIGGRVVIVGIPATDAHTIPAGLARRKGLSIIMSRRMKSQHLLRAIELVDDGSIRLDGLITGHYRLERGPEAFAALANRSGLKVIVRP